MLNTSLTATIALVFVLPAPGVPVIKMFGLVRLAVGGVSAIAAMARVFPDVRPLLASVGEGFK